MSNIIQSLWIGKPLSKLEQLSIKSFLDNGHEYHLYIYDPVDNIPEGTIVKDGNEILDKNEIFYYKNGSVSAFSNLFRFTLLFKKGGYWADTDLLCTKYFKFEEDFVISSEPDKNYEHSTINAGLLKFKINSKEALEGIMIQRKQKMEILNGNVAWSSGPKTVSKIVEKFNLEKYVLPWQGICNCTWFDFQSIFDPYYKPNEKIINKVEDIPEQMVCIHLWNEILRRNNIDKNISFHPSCLYEIYKKKHNI